MQRLLLCRSNYSAPEQRNHTRVRVHHDVHTSHTFRTTGGNKEKNQKIFGHINKATSFYPTF